MRALYESLPIEEAVKHLKDLENYTVSTKISRGQQTFIALYIDWREDQDPHFLTGKSRWSLDQIHSVIVPLPVLSQEEIKALAKEKFPIDPKVPAAEQLHVIDMRIAFLEGAKIHAEDSGEDLIEWVCENQFIRASEDHFWSPQHQCVLTKKAAYQLFLKEKKKRML